VIFSVYELAGSEISRGNCRSCQNRSSESQRISTSIPKKREAEKAASAERTICIQYLFSMLAYADLKGE
jgi:hypothetical protein